MDAEWLNYTLAYAIHANCGATDVSVLKAAVESVLEHHLNNHSLCALCALPYVGFGAK
jgi:hypothetical protein